ncbi:DUF255 domain-containing protein [Bacillus atrophaeus]|nr:DUF255 domain-containing protein [Bacillus atrophaeus]MED1032426.1 DUF255 domain-containing protein [Bacillus atrophaeus]MED1119564.1 DUF255 domain-containing protein [Bacillus atrophaeus]MED1130200.1 DUF255 domain-containing protein [Bacillus atrophaeus]
MDWHPWGEEAFEKAKRENKQILISIGYSASHWCHYIFSLKGLYHIRLLISFFLQG